MNIERERAAFEDCFKSLGVGPYQPHNNMYVADEIQARWEAWQARAAIEADRQRRGEPVGYIMPSAIKQLKAGGNAIVGGVSQGFDVPLYTEPQSAEPVNKTDWSAELSSWSDEDFIQIFHERPDLAKRLRKMLAEPVKVPSLSDLLELADASLRDATRESWMGMPVAAYQWEVDNYFGKVTKHATHWSTAPQDAERLYRESDVRDLLERYGRGQK